MPGQPSLKDVHINAALTNISVAYQQDESVYVADKVFPMIPVQHQSDLYWKFNKSDFFRDEARKRAPGTESAGGGFNLSTGTYAAEVYAFHQDVPDQVRANADSQLQLDRAATQLVTQRLLIRRERIWANSFFTTGVWGTDITPANLWDTANGEPLADLETGKIAVQKRTGYIPNTLILSPEVVSKLRNNAKIRDQFKYTSSDSIDLAMMARYFNIERVLVVNAVYDAAVEGSAENMGFVVGKHGLLCYVPPSASIMSPASGYTFAWNGYLGAGLGTRIGKFRMEQLKSDRVEGEMAFDMRVICPDVGYFFNGLIS